MRVLRTAVPIWSPSSTLLATGTVSAIDESFSSESTLELWAPFDNDTTPLASLSANSTFTSLAWSESTSTQSKGVIAAGMDNGEIALYNPEVLLAGNGKDPLIARHDLHKGPVRGLEFNLHSRNLFASGASNGEIYIWDLTTPNKPYSPGTRSRSINDVTSLSWNAHVPHILATGSNSGYTVVWDLKSKREVAALSYSAAGQAGQNAFGQPGWGSGGGNRGVSCVQWHPDNPTKLVTASDDDSNPVIMLWDLRNQKEPERVLAGHEKGILSLSWCTKDAELLLSSGKDGRTLCWNPSSGEIVAEVTPSSNWSFNVQWCPRNPSMLSTASLDGNISIHAIQDTTSPDSAPVASTSQGIDGAGLFDQAISANAANYPTKSLTQTPKWLKRPASVAFGFGGKMVSVSSAGGLAQVSVSNVVAEKEVVSKALRLEEATRNQNLAAFCEQRSQEVSTGSLAPAIREGEVASWKLLGTLFGAEARGELVSLLGFSKAEIKSKVEEAIAALKDKLPKGNMAKSQSSGGLSSESVGDDSTSIPREPLVTFADTPTDGLSASSEGEASAANLRDGDEHPSETSVASKASEITEPSLFGSFDEPVTPGTPGTQQQAAADFYSQIGSGRPAALPEHVFHRDQANNSSVAATVGSASSVASLSLKPSTFKIYPSEESEVDRLITRALVLGDFESAVELSLSTERFADAILLAVRGGPELLAKTQKTYFERQTSALPYLRVFQSIVTDDLTDVVQNADLSEWQEIFVVLCTFAKSEEFPGLVEQLGQRLEYQFTVTSSSPTPELAPELRRNAVLCYLAAGKLEKVVSIWIEQMKEDEVAQTSATSNRGIVSATAKYAARAGALQTFVEKVTVFSSAVGYVDEDLTQVSTSGGIRLYKLAALYECYIEYADLLASQGLVQVALQYMSKTPVDFQGAEVKDFGPAETRDRIGRAGGQRLNSSIFANGMKIGAAPIVAAPYVAPGQQQSSYSGYTAPPAIQQQYSSPSTYPSIASVQQTPYPVTSQSSAYGAMPPMQQPQQRGYDDPYAATPINNYAPAPTNSGYQPAASPYTTTPYGQPAYGQAPPSQFTTPSPYGASNSFVPAPPTPMDGTPAFVGRSGPPPPSTGPPPKAKSEVQWNDAPAPKEIKKSSTPVPMNKPSAITSPFPMAAGSPIMGYGQGIPPPPPSRGSSRTPLQAAPPPPRAGQGPPPPPPQGFQGQNAMGRMMSPPLPPAGFGNSQQPGQPGQQQQGRFFQPPPPPPGYENRGPGPNQGFSPPMNPNQGNFRGAPTPPPNAGPYGRPTNPYPPPPPPPGQQQQFSGPPGGNRMMGGPPPPPQGFNGPPAPPGPYGVQPGQQSGPPSRGGMNSTPMMNSNSNSGPVVAPSAPIAPIRPEPPKSKYPAGDRSHIPSANEPIVSILSNEINRLKQVTPPQQMRMITQIEKKINILFDLLNCGTISESTQVRILELSKAIESRNQALALEIHLALITHASSEVLQFQADLKQLVSRM